MTILPINFGVRQGRITITRPVGAIGFTRSQVRSAEFIRHPNTVQHTLEGNWSGFPEGGVRRLDVMARTDRDYPWFSIPVNGAAEGRFAGEIFIWSANQITPVRFDGFDLLSGQLLFETGYYQVQTKFLGGPPPLRSAEPSVTFPEQFRARIARVISAGKEADHLFVTVWFNIQSVPPGTESLSLSFLFYDKSHWQGITNYTKPGEYCFAGWIAARHASLIGRPDGQKVGVGCILEAFGSQGGPGGGPQVHRDGFTLDQVWGPLVSGSK
jgi:hypothetical protein